MATTTGKKSRKRGGNRFALKRSHRRIKHNKKFSDNVMTPVEYQKEKSKK